VEHQDLPCVVHQAARLSVKHLASKRLKGFNLLSRNAIEVDYPVSIGDRSAR